jgi:ribosomal-protein-alanine N-acetyltransferase
MSKSASTKQTVHIRWMIRRDLPSILAIESKSFEFPWTEDEFVRCLRQRDCIGMVAECAERVVGFMIYELQRTRIHVLSFAVHPEYRRQSVGSAMIEKLFAKLAYQRRNRIVLEVRETNLPAQLFFKSLGFKATGVLRNFYDDSTEDAFLMQFRNTNSNAEIDSYGDYYHGHAG